MMKDVVQEYWHEILSGNGLSDFNALWDLKTEWFEPPNIRRGGWSGVCFHHLNLPDGGQVGVFIKRQENHVKRTWKHPFRGIATCQREYDNLRRMQRWGIPVPEVVYFACRREEKRTRAILITRELSGFKSLNHFFRPGQAEGRLRRHIMKTVACTLKDFHSHNFQHSSLYPKHILLRRDPDDEQSIQVVLIDWEKARRRMASLMAALNDLDIFYRHFPSVSRSEKILFWKYYWSAGRQFYPVVISGFRQVLARRIRKKQTEKEARRRRSKSAAYP